MTRIAGTLNGAIGEQIDAGMAYSILNTAWAAKLFGEKTINAATEEDISRLGDNSRVKSQLAELNNIFGQSPYKFVVVRGLKEKLPAGLKDVIFHYGVTRNQVYIDEIDLASILSLYNGTALLAQAFKHEIAHIENPEASEAEVEAMASTKELRLALLAIENGLGEISVAEMVNMKDLFADNETARQLRGLPGKYDVKTLADLLIAMTVAVQGTSQLDGDFSNNPQLKYKNYPYAYIAPRVDLIRGIAQLISNDEVRQEIGRALLNTDAVNFIPTESLPYIVYGRSIRGTELMGNLYINIDLAKYPTVGSLLTTGDLIGDVYIAAPDGITPAIYRKTTINRLMEVLIVLAPQNVNLTRLYANFNVLGPALVDAVNYLVSAGVLGKEDRISDSDVSLVRNLDTESGSDERASLIVAKAMDAIEPLQNKGYITLGEAIEKELAAQSAAIDVGAIRTGAPRLSFPGKTGDDLNMARVTALSRIQDGIVAGVNLPDIHGRVFNPDGRFFKNNGDYTDELRDFINSLSDKSVQEIIEAGIMYYDIRSKFWRENPAFTVAFALAFAKKLQEKTGKQDGIILHIAVDAYQKHFEAAQIFADAILRTGIFDNGGGLYYWGVMNGGDIRNYGQLYEALNGEGGNWVYFTMSHRPEDFLGSKLGIGAEVYCGPEVRHCEGVESGTLYDSITSKDFAPIKKTDSKGMNVITVSDTTKNNIRVAADMLRATAAPVNTKEDELLSGLQLGVDMGGSPIGQNLVAILKGLGVTDLVVDNDKLDANYDTRHIIDPNEHKSAAIARIKQRAQDTNRTWLAVDPDGDRGSIVAITPQGQVISMTGSQLLLLAIENMAVSYKEKGLGVPTVISDMRTGVAAKDLERALNARGLPVKVVPHEAGYPFFMRGMASLPADLAVENTCHAFTNPLTNANWGAPAEHNYPGYQGGDNAALFLVYLLGCMKHQWNGRNPAEQLSWIQSTYNLRDTVVDERKPSLPTEQDKYKYAIADKMKELAAKWFPDAQHKFVINFGDPKVKLVSGVHITNAKTGAMTLVRFSNTGSSFTISGEGYTREELDDMLALGHLLMVTAVKELNGYITTPAEFKANGLQQGKDFAFFEGDSDNLAGKFNEEEIARSMRGGNVRLTEKEARGALPFAVDEADGLFWPDLNFVQGKPIDVSLIQDRVASGAAAKALALLQQAKDDGRELSIEGHLRGVDGPGSSLDLPEFQVALTPQGVGDLADIVSTPTIASEFKVKIRFEKAGDENVIEYVAPDYGITEANPYKVTGPITLDARGRTPKGQKDAPAFIFTNLFGLRGIKITCEGIDAMALAGGMESSNVFNVALISAASMLSGANLSQADIFNLAVKLENDEFGGLTGGQGHLCTMVGSAYRHVWLSGIKDAQGNLINPYSALSIPLLKDNQLDSIEKHFMLVQAGKDYEDGKAAIDRTAAFINWMWTDLLRDRDSFGVEQHSKKLALAAAYTKALQEGRFDIAMQAINDYVDIRDSLCRRWADLMLKAHAGGTVANGAFANEAEEALGKKYEAKVFNPSNPLYEDYKVARDAFNKYGEDLRNISLYSLEPIAGLIAAGRKPGVDIAFMPLGAGGPGANLIAVSPHGADHIRNFLESQGMSQLTQA
ncbi:MAG TPA: hypothetical protein PLV52_01250, partial [Candidatus Omnitrophota bacterium]|nr:hypothetical protein [Candidatus Omnitrophota bacterium]